jgi:dynein heavy chain, axonemal
LTEIKSFSNPPSVLFELFAGFVILFESEIKANGGTLVLSRPTGQAQEKKEFDYFTTAKRYLLNDISKFIGYIRAFDISNISPRILKKLHERIFRHERMCLANVQKVSWAGATLYSWLKGVYDLGLLQQQKQSLGPLQSKEEKKSEKNKVEVPEKYKK